MNWGTINFFGIEAACSKRNHLTVRSPASAAGVDFLISLNECHLKLVLKSSVTHFNHGSPHRSRGPRDPAPPPAPPRRRLAAVIASPPEMSFAARRYWAVSIMNTPWRRPRRELCKEAIRHRGLVRKVGRHFCGRNL